MANEKGNPNHASNGQFASGGGSGGKSEAHNIGSGIAKVQNESDEGAKKFPVGSKVRANQSGSEVGEVIGHSGNMVHTTKGDLHVTKTRSAEVESSAPKSEQSAFGFKHVSKESDSENTPRAIKERKEAAKRGQLHFEGGVAKEEKEGTWKPTDVEKSSAPESRLNYTPEKIAERSKEEQGIREKYQATKAKDELPEWKGRNLDKNPVGDKYPSASSADCGGAAVWPGRTLD